MIPGRRAISSFGSGVPRDPFPVPRPQRHGAGTRPQKTCRCGLPKKMQPNLRNFLNLPISVAGSSFCFGALRSGCSFPHHFVRRLGFFPAPEMRAGGREKNIKKVLALAGTCGRVIGFPIRGASRGAGGICSLEKPQSGDFLFAFSVGEKRPESARELFFKSFEGTLDPFDQVCLISPLSLFTWGYEFFVL